MQAPRRAPNGALDIAVAPATAAPEPGSVPAKALKPYPRYRVGVQEYITFHEQGFLIVRGLVPPEDVQELVQHTDDLIHGRIDVPGAEPSPPGTSPQEIERRYLRIHMLHRVLEIHECFLLHPRILDVLEALIGPDVMAMQSMLFLKFPGGAGQGYHQDSYYIPTMPDSLCGAWLAVDRADEENGCMWFTVGTQHEPIYPTTDNRGRNHGDSLADLEAVENVSNTDDEVNTTHARHLYTVLIDPDRCGLTRDEFVDAMTRNRIGVGVHYLSIAEHPFYQRSYGWKPEDWPHAMSIGRRRSRSASQHRSRLSRRPGRYLLRGRRTSALNRPMLR